MAITPDYIVVGAGSAGCVLAYRLTAQPDTTVLLLEAGGPDRATQIQVPAAFSKLFKGIHDWNYSTEPQEQCNGRRLYWPRGKVLGGSSSINAMIYNRGHASTYDAWAELGNPGWSYAEVLPYFKRGEHQERGANDYHGIDGPQNVADPRSPNTLSQAFIDSAKALGIPENQDFNGATQEGVGYYQVNQKNGARHSAANAYLVPALDCPNLAVVTGAMVTRILFEGKKAVGIEYEINGQRHDIRCNKEVLLCGGAINSPQLLLLSGIGDGDTLQSLGIEVVHHLPGVGQNLQDHLLAGIMWNSTQPITLATAETLANLATYVLRKTGPLSSNVAEAGGFIRINPDAPAPDVQLYFAPTFYVEHGFRNPEGHGFAIGASLVQPYSRGYITLKTPNPADHPAIQPHYYQDERDLHTMVAGVKLARKIGNATPFDPYRGTEALPGSDIQSDEGLVAFIRETTETIYHPIGTCKMGTDPLAVVDPQLRVHGIEGLRVVDASVMPTIVNANTNAPTMMIAEKASDMIVGV